MEVIFLITAISLFTYMVLATYDGLYLHLWKYQLYNRIESKLEHLTHTLRAILFPLIVIFLVLNQQNFFWFLIGLLLVVIDFVILAIDAHSEEDSRKFMGGLPKQEYILHLFANATHYGLVVLIIALKIRFTENTLLFISEIDYSSLAGRTLLFVAENAVPGAFILALLHILLAIEGPRNFLHNQRIKVNCC
ncbi:hypothetical protein [Croceivirga thetidis]|uniref:Uncharacterized protein n=1 Tax=Croceivirga thetidis TaxID=2721623 RepID=A0ABX1GP26_9FLAO|nr:hypothetical protein [Croceivirga thetidis]NKI30836.1 hypothetical protein [Croceivirga thetidis]